MNNSKLLYLPLLTALCALVGCASNPAPVPAEHRSVLVQLDDRYWVDLTDVQEIAFAPAGDIRVWHRGSGDPFDFSFDDHAAAVRAWKKLVTQLGGSLDGGSLDGGSPKEPDVKIAPASMPPVSVAREQGSYANLHEDLGALSACRDEKLLTPGEYENAHQRAVSNFIKICGQGNTYGCVFVRLRAELTDLQGTHKDQLLDDNSVAALHAAILARYGIAPE